MTTERPLLCLSMVLTHESADHVRATLAAVRPAVEKYAVVVAAETNALEDVVKQALEGVPGSVVHEPFTNFSDHRNRALELAGAEPFFALVVEAGEILENAEALRSFCQKHKGSGGGHHGAYQLRLCAGSLWSDAPRVVRTGYRWRYVGAAYESLIRDKAPTPSLRVPDVRLVVSKAHQDTAFQRARAETEMKLLNEEAAQRPKDGRVVFALALTAEKLGDNRRALGLYEKRAKMGGRQEEVYESLYRSARLGQATGKPWAEIQQAALLAHTHSPHRAEPLHLLAWHYYERKNWPLTFLFAHRGAMLPFPEKATLFVDRDVYNGKLDDLVGTSAYYVGEFAAGEAAVRRALERSPGEERLRKNLAFYQGKRTKPNANAESAKDNVEPAASEAEPKADAPEQVPLQAEANPVVGETNPAEAPPLVEEVTPE